ncbi:MAG: hypothetical protein H7A00_02835 [Hahellaceae bacterium]|nr:hypothetical protein [Hahellaceae bacterium]
MEHLMLLAGVYNCMAAMILLFRQPAGIEGYDIMTINFGYTRIMVGACTAIIAIMYFFLHARVELLPSLLSLVITIKLAVFALATIEVTRHEQPLEDLIPVAMVNALFSLVLIGLYIH